jgi:hypothetical protein
MTKKEKEKDIINKGRILFENNKNGKDNRIVALFHLVPREKTWNKDFV